MKLEEYQSKLDFLKSKSPKLPVFGILNSGPTAYNCIRLEKELAKINTVLPEERKSAENVKLIKKSNKKSHPKEFFPKELHAAWERKSSLYGFVNQSHSKLEWLWDKDQEKVSDLVHELTNAWSEIKSIYRLLDYWEENQVVLENKYSGESLNAITDKADLKQRMMNLRSYVSKNKKKPEKAIQVQKWKDEIAQIEIKLNE